MQQKGTDMLIAVALCLGVVSGLRAVTSPAVVSWAARMGVLALTGTHLAFLGYTATPWVLTALALAEIVNDKLPGTPSRKVPAQVAARVVSGAVVGAAIGTVAHAVPSCLIAGILGALAGTYGGAAVRGGLAKAFGRDLPAALVEDAVAILLAIFAVSRV